ncbi:uncharacterized protein BDW47DRAFT_100693 [Aspergillus candidus]|uniref:Uncharacterized protein n=1 Tax=Aspergillus candidus TaxID=41067 RepID=A0A2I2FJA9_ASPCN|nr:hypothetical protein BDW47DRAFT_100693 [Aspergillus candidus]PLB40711.1 hypothetical protein BDW47DRAFT_100693 [Aspergillus candidus]
MCSRFSALYGNYRPHPPVLHGHDSMQRKTGPPLYRDARSSLGLLLGGEWGFLSPIVVFRFAFFFSFSFVSGFHANPPPHHSARCRKNSSTMRDWSRDFVADRTLFCVIELDPQVDWRQLDR